MNLIIKGFIIGLGKIIPGVSGSMLAISLGIYEEIIEKISSITKNFRKNIEYLAKISIGIILAIILTSKIIVKCLNHYYFPTMLLFIGLITGGIPNQLKKTKLKIGKTIISIIIIILALIIMKNIGTIHNHQLNYSLIEFIKLIGIGIVDAISSIIPGISGTALLMTLGYYNIILEMFSSILQINKILNNTFIIIPFAVGFTIGTILISKIINKIIKKNKETMYSIANILMIITITQLLGNVLVIPQPTITYIIGFLLFFIGILLSSKIKSE